MRSQAVTPPGHFGEGGSQGPVGTYTSGSPLSSPSHDCDNGWVEFGDAVARCPQCVAQRQSIEVAHARTTDPETSHEAAASLGNVTELQLFVHYCLLDRGPSTDEQLVRYIHQNYPNKRMTEQSVRSRRAELVKRGMVRDSGHRRPTSTGRRSRVWKAVA